MRPLTHAAKAQVVFAAHDPRLGRTTARVLRLILQGIRHTTLIARAVGVTTADVRWHLGKLRKIGILVPKPDGKGDVRTDIVMDHPDPMPTCSGEHTCHEWVAEKRKGITNGRPRKAQNTFEKSANKFPKSANKLHPPCFAQMQALMQAACEMPARPSCAGAQASESLGHSKQQQSHRGGVGENLAVVPPAVSEPVDLVTVGFDAVTLDNETEGHISKRVGRAPDRTKPVTDTPTTGYQPRLTGKAIALIRRSRFSVDTCDPVARRVATQAADMGLSHDQVACLLLSYTIATITTMLDKATNARLNPAGYLATVITRTQPALDLFEWAQYLHRTEWSVYHGRLVIEAQSKLPQVGAG